MPEEKMDISPSLDKVQPNTFSASVDSINIIPASSGSTVPNRQFQSPNYIKGVSGWRLGNDGVVEFNEDKSTLSYLSRFRVHRTADQTIGASSVVKIQYNLETFDSDAEFDSSTNYRFVVENDGTYFFHTQVHIDTTNLTDQAEIGLIIRKNGSNISSTTHRTSGTGAFSIQVTDILSLVATDYIEVFVNNTIAASITAYGDQGLTHFEGFRVF